MKYTADDGKQFDNENDCLYYEKELDEIKKIKKYLNEVVCPITNKSFYFIKDTNDFEKLKFVISKEEENQDKYITIHCLDNHTMCAGWYEVSIYGKVIDGNHKAYYTKINTTTYRKMVEIENLALPQS